MQKNSIIRSCGYGLLFLFLGLLLASCADSSALMQVDAQPSLLEPSGSGETVDIRYAVGCDSRVSIYLQDAAGKRYQLRDEEPRNAEDEPYVLRFDGTVPTNDAVVRQQLLPDGTYTAVVQASSDHCGNEEVRLPITIAGSDVPMPDIENLVVWPTTISPNADAIDDVTEITYRLPVTATVDMMVTTPQGQDFPLLTREEQTPAEWKHVWDGKRPDGALLPGGVYTLTLTAEDQYGNLVQRQKQVVLEHVGDPDATIVYARIAPQQLMLGRMLTITARVRNTGPVPIRTYGPPSGFAYSTNEVFSSVEDGAYTSHAGGFWRLGADWDANSGDGPKRYPFRWALSDRPPSEWKIPYEEDWLLPGEEVEVVGRVVVQQRETKMGFYVGLIQDGVGFYQDRTARTIVEVGF
jgi:hypothetical protein